MDSGLKGRVALVSGGTSGIGLAIAGALAAEGAQVVVLGRGNADTAGSDALSASAPDQVLRLEADLTDDASVAAAVTDALAWKGQLNVVVNCAGPPLFAAPVAGGEDDQWLLSLNTKLMGTLRLSRAVLPHLATDGTGRIVNISGVTAKSIIPNAAVTGSTNAAVEALTSYLAHEGAPRNILVNAVCPGMTRTQGWLDRHEAMAGQQDSTPEKVRQGMTDRLRIQLDRWAEPEEIANVALFLASDLCSFVTGEVITVDGGQSHSVGS
jgi:3-oxoacyl-[acyl-carrier protein] reductase